VFLN
jgi:surface polysaccharide O-acyltransferase-like enzyme